MLHFLTCVWVITGEFAYEDIQEKKSRGIETDEKSWIDDYKTPGYPAEALYLTSFYFTTTTVTTVGYGDYSGATSSEYIFSIILEFLGLTFFSFLMGSINSIFDTSDNFDDLIEQKLDQLDMWIKKIEKSNKPFHI